MIFRLAALTALVASAAAKSIPLTDIKASSPLGTKLLSRARRLGDEADFQWVVNYSVKFQGCHHQLEWNEDADGEDEAKIFNQRLVRFRLCPTNSCDSSSSGGCDASSAGEYVVNLNEFVDAYTEAKMEAEEYECEMARETCQNYQCQNANDDEACEASCLQAQGLDNCVEEEDGEQFEVQRYIECAEYDGGGRRRLADGVQYFIGPYCSSDGSKVHLGLFTDETCTVEAASGTFETISYGKTLPYSSQSLVGMDCWSCKEPVDAEDQNQNDQQDEDDVIEMCERLYEASGKCESNLGSVNYWASEEACNYIQGIQITRSDGSVVVQNSGPSKAAGAFIGIFCVSTILLGAYVYYLKSKLDRSRINLGSE